MYLIERVNLNTNEIYIKPIKLHMTDRQMKEVIGSLNDYNHMTIAIYKIEGNKLINIHGREIEDLKEIKKKSPEKKRVRKKVSKVIKSVADFIYRE